MAVKCLNCGYRMSTWQEAVTLVSDIFEGNKKSIVAGHFNNKEKKCPKCYARGQWEDDGL